MGLEVHLPAPESLQFVHGMGRQGEWQGAGGIEGVARGDNGSGRVQEELREWQGAGGIEGVAGCRGN